VLFAPRDLPPLGPDVAADPDRYRAWSRAREAERVSKPVGALPGGRTDVLVVVESPETEQLRQCLRSVTHQTNPNWRLSIVTVGNPGEDAEAVLTGVREVWGPERVGRHSAPHDTDPADAAALAFERSVSPTVLLLGQHDQLTPDALALLGLAIDGVQTNRRAEVAYADEDQLDANNEPVNPSLKPDWSPDFLLSGPYLGRPLLLRRGIVAEAGGICRVPGGDWEHDLMLRVTERAGLVAHVAEVLCHRRHYGALAPRPTGDGAVAAALSRRRESGEVSPGPVPGTWSVHRRPEGRPSVSVIIPFRDGAGFLRSCVDSVSATVGDIDLDLVLVDNGSVDPETHTLVEHLAARPEVTILRDPRNFNWAALNNVAAASARGEVLVFLNNDIEAPRAGWLEALAAHALRPEIGAVGARLVYPGGRVQHAGVVVGIGGAAGHVLAGLPGDQPGYLGMAVLTRNCSAVTGACMAVRRAVFDEIGGFDELLGLDLNDIDFCLRAIERGYRIVYEPLAELVHYESPSRGTSGSVANITSFIDRWEALLKSGDPYLSRHITRVDSSCALRGPDEEGWWQEWRLTLGRS
jgi:GT2 family glycosyltransferase